VLTLSRSLHFCFPALFFKTNNLKGVSSFLSPAHHYGSGWKLIKAFHHTDVWVSQVSNVLCVFGTTSFVPHYTTKERKSGRCSSCVL